MLNGIKTINGIGIVVWIHPKTGERHRLDGPVYVGYGGYREYYINGNEHNINGPSTTYGDGGKEYYIDGMYFGDDYYLNQNHKWLLISLKRKLIQKRKY